MIWCNFLFFFSFLFVLSLKALSELFWILILYLKKILTVLLYHHQHYKINLLLLVELTVLYFGNCSNFSYDSWDGFLQMCHIIPQVCAMRHSLLLWLIDSLCFYLQPRCSWKHHLPFQYGIFTFIIIETISLTVTMCQAHLWHIHACVLWGWCLSLASQKEKLRLRGCVPPSPRVTPKVNNMWQSEGMIWLQA